MQLLARLGTFWHLNSSLHVRKLVVRVGAPLKLTKAASRQVS